jgi:peptide chain release factor subunit 3
VPISGITGDNIVERVKPETCSWYEGPSLTELLENLPLAKRDSKAALRLPILDKMIDQGSRYLFGKIEQGTVALGDKCMVAPEYNATQIAVIYNSKNQEVPYARTGENVKLKLLHLENDGSVNPGDVLCSQDAIVPTAEVIECEVEILELLTYKPIFCRGYACMLHMHTLAEECIVKEILTA